MNNRYRVQTLLTLLVATPVCERAYADETTLVSDDCQIKIATGKKGKGFSKLFRDIDEVCGQKVRVCELETAGGLDNLTALSANKADVGFVQVDTLRDMRSSDENIAALQCVLPASINLLHVVSLREGYSIRVERSLNNWFQGETKKVQIDRFSKLKGHPVALVGTAQLLARTLDKQLELGLSFVDADSDELAIVALRAGEVAAVLSVSGWPSGAIEKLSAGDLTLVTYDLTPEAPRVVVRKNYPNLGVFNNLFLGMPSILATRPFTPTGARGRAVTALRRCIVDNLETLQEGAFDPAWKEVKSANESYGLSRFVDAPAAVEVTRAATSANGKQH